MKILFSVLSVLFVILGLLGLIDSEITSSTPVALLAMGMIGIAILAFRRQ